MWELWSQELNDFESRELEGGKMLQEQSVLLSVSCNVYSAHYIPCVNIERNNNYCLIGRVGFCRQCFTPSNKGSRIVRQVITPITKGAQIMLHAHFAGTGGVLVVILGWRQCRVFTLNTNWGQYYNEDFISILGKVEARCGCWK